MNHFMCTGRVVSTPKSFVDNAGEPACKFSIAENLGNDKVNYFDIVCFKKTAEIVNLLNIDKGDKVTVSCRVEQHKWKAQDGTNRSSYNFVCLAIDLSHHKLPDSTPIEGDTSNLPL